MAPKPTAETVATAKLIFDSYKQENVGKSFEKVISGLTGYSVEVIAMVQAMVYENAILDGNSHASMIAEMFISGAWLARKHAEHVLAHLASKKRQGYEA